MICCSKTGLAGAALAAALMVSPMPVLAGDAGAFIGGMITSSVLRNMRDRTQAEQVQDLHATGKARPARQARGRRLYHQRRVQHASSGDSQLDVTHRRSLAATALCRDDSRSLLARSCRCSAGVPESTLPGFPGPEIETAGRVKAR